MKAEEFLEEAKALKETIIYNRRYLHSHAETGFHLKETLSFVKKELLTMGYQPIECGKAGLIALAGGKNVGKTFLIRADMDALPIQEEAAIDFPSVNGNMHACGHDMHTAMLLCAARLLKKHEQEIQGTIKLMFQPAEEIFEGSYDMIQAGLLKNPTVDAAFMIHVMANMPFPAGTIIVSSPGISAPAADFFKIIIQGKGCHGSMPNTGVDPLNAAAHIFIALQTIQTRELAISEPAALTIGIINAGTAPNVIPDKVVMEGSIRTFDEEIRSLIKERIIEISNKTASAFRAKADVTFGNGCPTLVNDKKLSLCMERYAKELLGESSVFSVAKLNAFNENQKSSKTAGSEDFAYVSQKVPSIMLALAAGQPENGYCYPQHHPLVTFDENALVSGSAIYAYTAMRWLEDQ